MLHELLLALSGHPSPLLSGDLDKDQLSSLLSPPEKTLLDRIARLGVVHAQVRARASSISTSHPSLICRAVSTAIVSTHLASFQDQILQVERSILQEDAKLVGAYDIVPLSSIAGAFDGWDHRLEWFWELVQFIEPGKFNEVSKTSNSSASREGLCSGSQLIDRLRNEAQTGYPDLHNISLNLVKVAESAWLRQVSAWVLYGRLPTLGAADFYIQEEKDSYHGRESTISSYRVQRDLIPGFVTYKTASSILFVGKSLNLIKHQESKGIGTAWQSFNPQGTDVLSIHLKHLASLTFPIASSSLSAAIGDIRTLLSQHVLQRLLPLSKVQEILGILKSFFLLERGEFAVALIAAADDLLSSRNRPHAAEVVNKHTHRMAGILIKEGEVLGVLARTWTTLASLHEAHDDDFDEEVELARGIVRLSIKQARQLSAPRAHLSDQDHLNKLRYPEIAFDDMLLTVPTALLITVPPPLDICLTPSETEVYTNIFAYLVSIRRAHLHLTGLWKLTALRREYPSPERFFNDHQKNKSEPLATSGQSGHKRSKAMRKIWAIVSSAAFFLAEIGEYFQGEVVNSSWSEFHRWLEPISENSSTRIATMANVSHHGRPPPDPDGNVVSDDRVSYTMDAHDPERLSDAHRSYLASLARALLLDDVLFTRLLRRFMTKIDYLVSLVERLSLIHIANHKAEEQEIMDDLSSLRANIQSDLLDIIRRLKEIDIERLTDGLGIVTDSFIEEGSFVPWKGAGVDRLLMKLDSINLYERKGEER